MIKKSIPMARNGFTEEIQKQNLSTEGKRMLVEEKKKGRTRPTAPSASKLVLLGTIALCVQIVIFCEYAMLTLGDTSSMYVLIGIPAALAPIIWGYYSKSKAENVAGGIVYESAMAEIHSEDVVKPDEHANDTPTGDAVG